MYVVEDGRKKGHTVEMAKELGHMEPPRAEMTFPMAIMQGGNPSNRQQATLAPELLLKSPFRTDRMCIRYKQRKERVFVNIDSCQAYPRDIRSLFLPTALEDLLSW